ncbi:S41 family peptidase [Nocardioides sp. URHA0020]|uniref:S41 family peptidase n=1 Tax=Nocardioides sp. URHA0020 TaxID=1380392 RepID=UPI000686297D|nr:S41 family peptidase [Nocardioides sp. URHA0020]
MLIPLVQDLVRAHYVFPDVAEQIAAGLSGLDLEDGGPVDAATLTTALQSVNGDRHLRVRHYPDGVPPEDDEAAVRAWFATIVEQQGPGISAVRRLDGNVGLLAVGPIIPTPEHLGPAAAAAFTLLRGVSRVVIDARDCVGGVPESVALLVSHLCGDAPVHLQDLLTRDGTVVTSCTTPSVTPKVPADVPVDVLTSARTFSGGEELAYDLQALGRARVVGATTGGGAHPREAFDLTAHLQLHVPTARSVNAVTGTNWEGTGVRPDLECAAEVALETALETALATALQPLSRAAGAR